MSHPHTPSHPKSKISEALSLPAIYLSVLAVFSLTLFSHFPTHVLSTPISLPASRVGDTEVTRNLYVSLAARYLLSSRGREAPSVAIHL